MNERAVSIVSGALVGLLVIGILGHVTMAAISYIINGVNHLSVRGIVQAAIIGLIIGMLGGFIRYLMFRTQPQTQSQTQSRDQTGPQTMALWIQSLILGGILFVISGVLAVVVVPGVLPIRPVQIITFAVVFFIYWIYAFVLGIAVNRCIEPAS